MKGKTVSKLTLLGGEPIRTKPWRVWPQYDDTERIGRISEAL